ncbi:MAG: VWA domain-containing protein [Candidatus Saccharimonas sp.]|nr:VWA domain-containing protein [Planctomycetaceae bacterium]
MSRILVSGDGQATQRIPKSAFVGLGVSALIHVSLLVALSFVVFHAPAAQLQMIVDSVFTEERMQEEFTQDLEQSTEAAQTVSFIAGAQATGGTGVAGGGGTGGGGGGTGVSQQKLDDAPSLKEPVVRVNIGSMGVPGTGIIGKDLGTGQVSGEAGRVVEGYGAALGQMTQELVRMMRESKVLVVWLFDESESMKDDQKEVRERFHKVYEELGLVQKQDAKLKISEEILLTSIMSFGKGIVEHTAKPTSNIDEIKKAIDKIGVDESGLEYTCAAIMSAVGKYQQFAQRQKRKLILIVVSDESGDDGEKIEEAIQRCKSAEAPVYVMGHYSVFGYPYARISWVDPKHGLTHWLPINRGPETPLPECLQFDGLHARWDVFSSGVGPYEQVRIAKQTGGIFFMLPGNEDNLAGAGSFEQRKFDMLDMKEYLPDLSSRMEYSKARDASRFRDAQWKVISLLNPFIDPNKEVLNMQEHHYSIDPAVFATQGKTTFERALKTMGMLNDATKLLDSVKKLRDKEPSERWRANYDLMHAQCLGYRVRLFQLLLSLDQHQKNKPKPKDEKNNEWDIHRTPQLLEPDKEQIKLTKVDLDELKQQNETARAEYQAVIENHPRTPYARRAQWELQYGFGMKFAEVYRNPKYLDMGGVKFPKQ